MKHERRAVLLDHALNPRFLQHRWRCEACDCQIHPDEVLCEACTRDMLDTEMDDGD